MTALMSIKEAAQLLKVSISTVYKYVERKEIGFVKIGASLRFTEADVVRFIDAHTSAARPSDKGGRK